MVLTFSWVISLPSSESITRLGLPSGNRSQESLPSWTWRVAAVSGGSSQGGSSQGSGIWAPVALFGCRRAISSAMCCMVGWQKSMVLREEWMSCAENSALESHTSTTSRSVALHPAVSVWTRCLAPHRDRLAALDILGMLRAAEVSGSYRVAKLAIRQSRFTAETQSGTSANLANLLVLLLLLRPISAQSSLLR